MMLKGFSNHSISNIENLTEYDVAKNVKEGNYTPLLMAFREWLLFTKKNCSYVIDKYNLISSCCKRHDKLNHVNAATILYVLIEKDLHNMEKRLKFIKLKR